MSAVIPDSRRCGRFMKAGGAIERVGRFARSWLIGPSVVVGLLALPSLAGASVAQEEQMGSRLLGALESGRLHCAEASSTDFDRIGEYVMGRMSGSPRAHEAMNNMMSTMMGADSEQQMHEAMGRRFAGCGGGRLPAGFGRMMGTVNAMGMMGGGMMGAAGQAPGAYGNPGSMMGGYGFSAGTSDADFDGPSAAAMIGMMAVLIGAAALALFLLTRRHPGGPLETLKRRFAEGELTAEEYQERKRLLEGS